MHHQHKMGQVDYERFEDVLVDYLAIDACVRQRLIRIILSRLASPDRLHWLFVRARHQRIRLQPANSEIPNIPIITGTDPHALVSSDMPEGDMLDIG